MLAPRRMNRKFMRCLDRDAALQGPRGRTDQADLPDVSLLADEGRDGCAEHQDELFAEPLRDSRLSGGWRWGEPGSPGLDLFLDRCGRGDGRCGSRFQSGHAFDQTAQLPAETLEGVDHL